MKEFEEFKEKQKELNEVFISEFLSEKLLFLQKKKQAELEQKLETEKELLKVEHELMV